LVNWQRAVERARLQMGITLKVYGEQADAQKVLPFDLVPCIVPAAERSRIERRPKQGKEGLLCKSGLATN